MGLELPATMDAWTAAIIILGSLIGGFANGLAGFGTGMTGLPFWLQAVPPPMAAELGCAAGVSGQLATLRAIWHAIDWRRLAPMLVAGLVGVPLGAALLGHVDVKAFKRGVGFILAGYSTTMLAMSYLRVPKPGDNQKHPPRRMAEMVVGFIGGLMGGMSGLSGVAPTIWAAMQGWNKEERRGVFQAFNLTILSATLVAHLVGGLLGTEFLAAFAIAVPGTLTGVAAGQAIYARLDDLRFDRAVLMLLAAAGIGLLLTTR